VLLHAADLRIAAITHHHYTIHGLEEKPTTVFFAIVTPPVGPTTHQFQGEGFIKLLAYHSVVPASKPICPRSCQLSSRSMIDSGFVHVCSMTDVVRVFVAARILVSASHILGRYMIRDGTLSGRTGGRKGRKLAVFEEHRLDSVCVRWGLMIGPQSRSGGTRKHVTKS
jgi:hypothetical protein